MSAGAPLRGTAAVPGDKSVTHRGLLLGAVARGTTVLRGALDALDTRSTAGVVAALGARIDWAPGGLVTLDGAAELRSPATALDCGNSGTTARLLLGLLAGRPGHWRLTGDASLRARPMARVASPLLALGARIACANDRGADDGNPADGVRLPLELHGAPLAGGSVVVELPSAQVKSALLLAGLTCREPLTVIQPVPTRDHTERLLPRFGARCTTDGRATTIHPGALRGAVVDVPGDPSAAAFLAVAALLTPGSDVQLTGVGLWPRRTGWIAALTRAGATINACPAPRQDGEPVGALHVRAARLTAFDIPPDDVPDLVDEIPILALAAARAAGTSRFRGLSELRVKESDRVAGVARLLQSLGVRLSVTGDELTIHGQPRWTGRPVADDVDHRLLLTAAVARHVQGLPPEPDAPAMAVSWPGFGAALATLTAT